MKYEDFEEKVLFWAKNRGFDESDPSRQFLKVVEESVEEISEALMTNNDGLLKDSIGDVAVTLIILKFQLDSIDNSPLNVDELEGLLGSSGSVLQLFHMIGKISGDLARNKIWEARLHSSWALGILQTFARRQYVEFEECIETAWNEIKDRNGLMIDSVFIKEEDFTEFEKQIFRKMFQNG